MPGPYSSTTWDPDNRSTTPFILSNTAQTATTGTAIIYFNTLTTSTVTSTVATQWYFPPQGTNQIWAGVQWDEYHDMYVPPQTTGQRHFPQRFDGSLSTLETREWQRRAQLRHNISIQEDARERLVQAPQIVSVDEQERINAHRRGQEAYERQLQAMENHRLQQLALQATPEWQAGQARRVEEERALRSRMAAAQERAEQLLMTYLDEEQRVMYAREKAIIVRCPSGRRYRLRGRGGLAGNVDEIDERCQVTGVLCAHGPRDIPMGDQLLTQMFMLRYHEDEFRRTANRHM